MLCGMTYQADGTFDVTLTPGQPELDGQVSRFDFDKVFHGDLEGTGHGLMLSAGEPANGSAGYVAIEVVTGRLGEREGSFALQQMGQMSDEGPQLRYEIVNGSGTGALQGIRGSLDLAIDAGEHRYRLDYALP